MVDMEYLQSRICKRVDTEKLFNSSDIIAMTYLVNKVDKLYFDTVVLYFLKNGCLCTIAEKDASAFLIDILTEDQIQLAYTLNLRAETGFYKEALTPALFDTIAHQKVNTSELIKLDNGGNSNAGI